MPKAFIFDLDGVITDTAEYHYRAWKQVADEEGVPFTREDNEQLRGVSRRQSLLFLLKGKTLSEPEMEDWMARKNALYLKYLQEMTPADVLPGVVDFLKEARQRGIKTGLASSSKNAQDVIAKLQLNDLLDALGDGFSVTHNKPAPDLFIWVAGRLGVAPAQAVVFEDAEAGVDAALAAGMMVVGLGPQNRVGKANVVLPDLAHATVDSVLQALPVAL